MMAKNKNTVLCLLLIFTKTIFSQEVNLEVAGNRQLEPFYRITKQAKLIDSIIPISEIQFPLLSLKYKTSFALDSIKTAKIKLVDKMPNLNKGYIRMGIGSSIMPLFDAYYNSVRSRSQFYSVQLKHLSSFGSIKGFAPAQFDRTLLQLSGKKNENDYSISGKTHFISNGLHHYGIRNPQQNRDSISQRFTDFGVNGLFEKIKKDSLTLNYNVGLDYNYFQDKKNNTLNWNAKEHYLATNTKLWYKLGRETLNLDASLKLNSYKYGDNQQNLNPLDSNISNTNFLFNLNPFVATYAQNNRLKIKFGALFALDYTNNSVKSNTNAFIYPDVEVKYSLFDDILIPYLKINGELKQNSFRNLSKINEFILSNIQLQNENNFLNATLGFKGSLSNSMLFNISASYLGSRNKALFVSDTIYSLGNRFNVIYDNVNTFRIEGSIIYQMEENIKIEAIALFSQYDTKWNAYAWNLPQFQFINRCFYQLLPQFSLNLDFVVEQGRKALVYNPLESDDFSKNQYSKNLGIITDFNLQGTYQYSQKLSAFLQFNNFMAQRYNKWYNYPVLGFQVLGGLTFKF
jgi:hypothetical protein